MFGNIPQQKVLKLWILFARIYTNETGISSPTSLLSYPPPAPPRLRHRGPRWFPVLALASTSTATSLTKPFPGPGISLETLSTLPCLAQIPGPSRSLSGKLQKFISVPDAHHFFSTHKGSCYGYTGARTHPARGLVSNGG